MCLQIADNIVSNFNRNVFYITFRSKNTFLIHLNQENEFLSPKIVFKDLLWIYFFKDYFNANKIRQFILYKLNIITVQNELNYIYFYYLNRYRYLESILKSQCCQLKLFAINNMIKTLSSFVYETLCWKMKKNKMS